VIVADDLGWTDLGCQGSGYYETPHVDRLAREGVRFRAAYAWPNCAPARATLLTGRYPARHGVWTVGSGARGSAEHRRLVPPPNRRTLPLEEVTLAEVLAARGYAAAHVGKWHLGAGDHGPRAQGFDVNAGGNASGHPRSYASPWANPDLADGPPGEHLTDRLAAEAVRFVAAHADEPFFLHLAFYAVHAPIQPRADRLERARARPPTERHGNAAYAALVAGLDAGVGRVLDALDEHGLARRTLVVFLSDNGGVGGYAREGVRGAELTDNAPLRGGKGMLYEGGVRVPLLVRLPGTAPAGGVADAPVGCVDLLPTVLEALGVPPPADVELDGTSFLDVLRAPAARRERPPLFWHFPGYLEGHADGRTWRATPAGAIRLGRWKLLERTETGAVELYDLARDPGERRDLAAQLPERARELRDRLEAWRRESAAPRARPAAEAPSGR
jgi:arylsulfatase A-like enzyme